MNETWIEKQDGYFYPKNAKMSPVIWEKLKMLSFEGLAEDRIYGIFILSAARKLPLLKAVR